MTLELASLASPLAGRLLAGDHHPRPFSGYVELIAALEAWRARDAAGSSRG